MYTDLIKTIFYDNYNLNEELFNHFKGIVNGEVKFNKMVNKLSTPKEFGEELSLIPSQFEETYIATRLFDAMNCKKFNNAKTVILYLRTLYNEEFGDFKEDESINKIFFEKITSDIKILETLSNFTEVLKLC